MDEPIFKNGAWWHRSATGWLRYDQATSAWASAPAGPPPPPPPPRVAGPLPHMPAAIATSTDAPVIAVRSENPARGPLATIGAGGLNVRILAGAVVGMAATVAAFMGVKALLADPVPTTSPAAVNATDTGASVTETELTPKQAFIARADEICARTNAELRALPQPVTAENVPGYLSRSKEVTAAATVELKTLTPPANDRHLWAKKLGHLDRGLALVDQAALAIRNQDAAAFARVEARLKRLTDNFNSWATKYGFQECNQPV